MLWIFLFILKSKQHESASVHNVPEKTHTKINLGLLFLGFVYTAIPIKHYSVYNPKVGPNFMKIWTNYVCRINNVQNSERKWGKSTRS